MTAELTRRMFLACLALAATGVLAPALAKDTEGGGDDGGGDNGGDDGGDDGGDHNGGGDTGGDDGGDDGGDHDHGGDDGGGDDDDDHDRALEAVERGEAAPLQKLLQVIERSGVGRPIDVKLRPYLGSLTYFVRVLGPDGRLATVRYNAKTLQKY